MSMDVVVWVGCSLTLPDDLPDSDNWKRYEYEGWVHYEYFTDEWLVNVGTAEKELLTEEIKTIRSDIDRGYVVSLEPIGANAAGYKFLEDVILTTVKNCGGAVVQDPFRISLLDSNGMSSRLK